MNRFGNVFAVACAIVLCYTDTAAAGNGNKQRYKQIVQRTRRTHRRKGVVAVKLTDDHKVGCVVKKLQKIR